MANRITDFFRRFIGSGKAETKPNRPLVPFTEFAPYEYQFLIPDLSLARQIEQYKGWVYACTKKIAQEFAAIGVTLYQMDKNGKITEIQTHPVLDLLDRVNQFITLYDLKELTSTYLELTGNAYWWLVKNAQGQIIEIYPWLRPDRMSVIPSVENFIQGYRYTVPGTNDSITFNPDEIIHFKFISPKDPYEGSSPVQAALMAIVTDEMSQRYNYRFFTNQARPDGVLQFKDGIEKDQAKRVLEKWNEMHGEGKEHRVAILSKGEYKPITLSQKDMDFLQQRTFGRDEILAMFNVPKSMLGITEDVNYATAEAARKMFLKQVVVPKMEKFVNYLNEFLLPKFDGGDNMFFDYENPVPEDQTMRLEYYASGIQNSWLSPNEVRVMEGLEPYQGGSNVFVPFNLVPSGSTDQAVTIKGMKNGEVKEIHIPKKFNIRHRSRTEDAKKQDMIAKIMRENGMAEKIARATWEKTRHEDQSRKSNLILQKDLLGNPAKLQLVWSKIWEMKINKTDNQERVFIQLMRREFNRQRDQVLKSYGAKALDMQTKASGVDFDVETEKDIFARIFEPILADIVRDHGVDSLNLLGRGNFDSASAMKDYLKTDGLKFAKEVNQVTKDAIKDQIAQGVAAGETEAKIKDRISGVFSEASAGRAQAIARTEVSRSSNFGTKEAFRQSGVVKYTEWFTASDEAVCELCGPMHGKKAYLDSNYFEKGDSFLGTENKSIDISYGSIGDPPLHVNCRCVLIPHTDDAEFFDKDKATDAFNLKKFEGSDDSVNAAARDQVKELMSEASPELKDIADLYDWKLQYVDLNNIERWDAANDAAVLKYMADMKSGDQFPPIAAIIQKGLSDKPMILDGAHRIEALRRLGANIIPMLVGRTFKKP